MYRVSSPRSRGFRLLAAAARHAGVVLLAFATSPALAKGCDADLCVGPQYALKLPSDAARVAKDGQSIAIAAGTYVNDVAVFRAHRLHIYGLGGYAHVKVVGVSAENKGIWVVKGDSATIERIEFSGASVAHMNGAGIRLEGTHLTLKHCYFHDNQTALLTGYDPQSDILIEHSEFAWSGAPKKNPHGIYIGQARSFTLKFSFVHHARVGHLVKSRARINHILYNRIADEADGGASYNIDLPNGGIAFVIGNVLHKGPRAEANALIAFGAERQRYSHPQNELYVVNNTLVSDAREARFVYSRFSTDRIAIVNNVFSGIGAWFSSPIASDPAPYMRGNVALEQASFVDAQHYDYRLRPGVAAIDAALDAGSAQGETLLPAFQYEHKAGAHARRIHGKLDAGAFEFEPSN